VNQGGTARTSVFIFPIASVTGSFAFGGVVINTPPVAPTGIKTIIVRNTGITNLVIPANGVSLTGDSSFTLVGGTCQAGANLAQATSSCTVIVSFAPTSAGAKVANLVIDHNGFGSHSIPVSGTGTVPVASVTPGSFGFPNSVQVNTAVALAPTQVFTLTNNGDGLLTIASINVTPGTGFTRVPGGCGATLGANGSSCAITVMFRPTNGGAPGSGGAISGLLRVISNTGGVAGTLLDVSLNGVATISASADVFPAPGAALFNATLPPATNPTLVQVTPVINVRNNDGPPNVGTVSIVAGSVTFTPAAGVPAGATATAEAVTATGTTVAPLTHVRFRLTPSAQAGLTLAQRQASKRGIYTVTYLLTNGGATATAVVTLTVN
jgi:hypothetical protein